MKRRYGYIPDFGDPRDHVFAAVAPPRAEPLPPHVDLRSKLPAAWDQGQLGSCTAFALTGAVAFLHGFVGSQLWLYYKERSAEHDVKADGGAQLRDGIKVLAKLGLPPEAKWPYVEREFAVAPPAAANRAAKADIITSYMRLSTLADMRNCLAAGFPFVVGISVFESFESDAVAENGEVPMPGAHERSVGGHAICVVGYREDGAFIVRNSWGTSWGDQGYFYLPQAYLADPDLATDIWTIRA